jgi:hypothetical protein
VIEIKKAPGPAPGPFSFNGKAITHREAKK